MENIQPIVPEGTPLPTPPVGVPPFPITPFAVWTWSSPVIPEFYWNVYSSEQRIKQICKEIGKIESYLNYLVNETNKNIIEIHQRIDQLTERVAALEKKVEEEVARLDALIAQLRSDLEQEIADREQGDENLDKRITQEIHDRQDADQVLHGEISQEVQDRIHADDQLHEEISHRLLPTDIQAGAEIEITRPDPNSNTIVIASTVAHSISELASTVSGLQAALTSETEERRADDTKLWTAVNARIERGKILAGAGIKVVNDPDESTVTISATGGGTGGGSTTVTGTAPVEVTGDPDEGYTVGVAQATEEAAGVITEARVKELAAGEGTAYTAGAGISISGNQISLNTSSSQAPFTQGVNNRAIANIIPSSGAQAGKVSTTIQFEPGNGIAFARNGALEISAKNATESSAGIISEARVKELAGEAGPSLSAEAPLKIEDGTLSLTKDPAGPVTSSSAGLSVREITPETESETETGVVSKKTIKDLATVSGGVKVAPNGGLKEYPRGEGIGVALDTDDSYNSLGGPSAWNPLGVSPDGSLMLTGGVEKLKLGSKEIDLRVDDYNTFFTAFSPIDIGRATTNDNNWKAEFPLTTGYFQVREENWGAWQKAPSGCFELYAEAEDLSVTSSSRNQGYPIMHALYVRLTPRGQAIYTNDPDNSEKTLLTNLKVTYSVYNLYILPTGDDE